MESFEFVETTNVYLSGKMQYLVQIGLVAVIAYFTAMAGDSFSATVKGTVTDGNGNALEHAVITLVGDTPQASSTNAIMPPPIMTQQDIQFNPFVLPVAAGTTVSFPNKDQVRHHVYSFSKVKRFELELYGEDEEKKVLFDKQGVVALGCNIHDNMLAYIYIARSKLFVKTNSDGHADLIDVPPGTYNAYVWHPRQKGDDDKTLQVISISEGGVTEISFEVDLRRERNRKRNTY